MEADFLREYQIDLVTALPTMTWRRFQVLLRGLSVHSATITALRSRQYIGGKRSAAVNEVVGPVAAQRAFEALFAPPKKKPATAGK